MESEGSTGPEAVVLVPAGDIAFGLAHVSYEACDVEVPSSFFV